MTEDDSVSTMLRVLLREKYIIQIQDIYFEGNEGEDLLCFKVTVLDGKREIAIGESYYLDAALADAYAGTPEREA